MRTEMLLNKTNQSSTPQRSSLSSLPGDWYWTLRWVISVYIITGNATISIIIITRRRLRNVTPNMFIVSLAVADYFVGVFIVPASYYCTFHAVCDWTIILPLFDLLLYASICNLCVMTLDRFVAVVFPYSYKQFMTRKKAWILIATAWIIPMVICVIPMAWKNKKAPERASYQYIYSLLGLFLVEICSCVLMLVTHISIYLVVRKHSRQIASQDVSRITNHTSKAKNERSTLKVFSLIVLLFILCYCLSIYRVCCKRFEICKPPKEVILLSRLLYLGNSAVNPFVYALMKQDIRRQMRNLVQSCLRRFGVFSIASSDEGSASIKSCQSHQ